MSVSSFVMLLIIWQVQRFLLRFKDFERCIRGSTTQHLSVLDYKIQQDNAKLTQIEQQVEAQQKELSAVSKQLVVERRIGKTFQELGTR